VVEKGRSEEEPEVEEAGYGETAAAKTANPQTQYIIRMFDP
jgi:hypothetical protein